MWCVGYFINAACHGAVYMVTSFGDAVRSCMCSEGSWNFHLVLSYWQRLGFWLIKYLQWWCDMLSLDATSLEQMFVLLGFRQALASELFIWWPFSPAAARAVCHHQAEVLFFPVKWRETSRFPSAREFKYGLVSLMHSWNIAVDVVEVWTIYRCVRLVQSQCFWDVYFDSWVQKQLCRKLNWKWYEIHIAVLSLKKPLLAI